MLKIKKLSFTFRKEWQEGDDYVNSDKNKNKNLLPL